MAEATPLFPCMRPGPSDRARAAAAAALSRLLWLANSDPPLVAKAEFYAVKDRLLRGWGRPAGHDWQEIVRECYGCGGSGLHIYLEGDSVECWRCGGSGVHERFWVHLERWELGGRVFHRPDGRVYRRPAEPVTIAGYVRHARVGRAGREAGLWLALLFDRRLFRRLMTATCWRGPTLPLPLVTLQKATFRMAATARRAARWPAALRRRLSVRHCFACGRRYFRPWSSSGWCPGCDRAMAEAVDSEMPF